MAWWEREARLYLGETPPFSLVRPQKHFDYPAFPQLPEAVGRDPEQLADFARRLIRPAAPDSVRLSADLAQTLVSWLQARNLGAGARLGAQRPFLPELVAVSRAWGAKLVAISRDDPGEDAALGEIDALVLSNPHRADGFFYPDEYYLRLYARIRRGYPQLPILGEESINLFTFNQVPPGTWRDLPEDSNLDLASSIYPVLSPQGPEIAWWHPSPLRSSLPAPLLSAATLPPEDLSQAGRALLMFQTRQGPGAAELARRLLVVERGLRIVADILKPALADGRAKVPVWPDTGFHLMVDVGSQLGQGNVKSWAMGLARETGILVTPGHLFLEPQMVQICFAASHPFLKKLADRVEQIDSSPRQGG